MPYGRRLPVRSTCGTSRSPFLRCFLLVLANLPLPLQRPPQAVRVASAAGKRLPQDPWPGASCPSPLRLEKSPVRFVPDNRLRLSCGSVRPATVALSQTGTPLRFSVSENVPRESGAPPAAVAALPLPAPATLPNN